MGVLVRVELHGAAHNEPVYTKLHLEMKNRGYLRTIASSDGTLYKLPSAEYYARNESDQKDGLKAGKESASAVGKTAWVLSSHTEGMTWELEVA